MTIPGDLKTTAMAVMPHKDADKALELALSMDIPFWPQLPHVSYYEDMYVQAAEHFPGILLDLEKRTLRRWLILTNRNILTSPQPILRFIINFFQWTFPFAPP